MKIKQNQTRRQFIKQFTLGSSVILANPLLSKCVERTLSKKLFLLRYDTEWWGEWSEMNGFIEKVIEIHRTNKIPATFFCKGETLFNFKEQFMDFHQEVKDDPLFDFQDHSYSHIGLGYSRGEPIQVLKEDYEKSFAIHNIIFGKRPLGISICGTSENGPALEGFDSNEKSKAEFQMVAGLGIKMINTLHSRYNTGFDFMQYAMLDQPEIMGFPSGYSDTAWMYRKEFGDPVEYIKGQIKARSERNEHMPLMLHDWVAWQYALDKELSHVVELTDYARSLGYELLTHIECYDRKDVWQF